MAAGTVEKTNDNGTSPDITIDEQIAELVETIRGAQQRITTLEARISDAKVQLRVLLEQRGSNWADDEGYARIAADSVRKFYDTRALDELIITDPLRYGWLKDYRREAIVRGSVQVK